MGGATLHESHSLPFVQMADLVAHAAYQAMRKKPDRVFMHDWYRDELVASAAARGRPIDVSDHWLKELRAVGPPASRQLGLASTTTPHLDGAIFT